MASMRKALALRFSQIASARCPPAAASTPANHPFSLRRLAFLHKRPMSAPPLPPDRFSLSAGNRLLERVRDLSPSRIRLEGLLPPSPLPADKDFEAAAAAAGVSLEEAGEVARASQIEAVKKRLRETEEGCIAYSVFLRICCEATGDESGAAVARSLDESGSVIVLGIVVFLRPEEVIKAIEKAIPLSLSRPDDPRRQELAEMEAAKVEIDRRAAAQVRRELWCGLGYLVAQTAVFMRLTFWELSWDVMEPICFYVTSMYVVAGYTFFLRTSLEPSFEGFFRGRFATKQKRLMKARAFDLDRFNELRRDCGHAPATMAPCRQEVAPTTSY